MIGSTNESIQDLSTQQASIQVSSSGPGKSLFNLKTRNSMEDYTHGPLKLPEIRLSQQDPFHDPG